MSESYPFVTDRLPAGVDGSRAGTHGLTIVAGPDAGRTEHIAKTPFRVGSHADSDLVLTDSAVSRTHFTIVETASGLVLEDLGSTNGTIVNRIRIQRADLPSGAIIRVGRTLLRFAPMGQPLHDPAQEPVKHGPLIGRSRAMLEVFHLIDRVAATDATALLLGESGTGKELAARAIHETSLRARGPFVVFDAAAVPSELIESELFGHERGAFTDATVARAGLFETAHGGTLFIDEVGELPLTLQPRLLRAIETREVRRVGADRPRRVDVRLVAATNRDLKAEVTAGSFRQDLYFRLAVMEIALPPLRDRLADVAPIVDAWLAEGGLPAASPELLEILLGHSWPGNVRELKNVITRALALSPTRALELDALEEALRSSAEPQG